MIHILHIIRDTKLSIAIYADSGNQVGLGHLKRCLCVAEELRSLSYQVEFLIDSNLYSNLIHDSGFPTRRNIDAGQNYKMIIVDNYNMTEQNLISYKKKCKILVRMDDRGPCHN